MEQKKHSGGTVAKYAVLILYAAFVLLPLLTVLLTSFMPSDELAGSRTFLWWSEHMSLDAYKEIFAYDQYQDLTGLPGFLMGFLNTLWITLIPLLVGLMVSGVAAFAFSKIDFPHKEGLFRFSIIFSMIPLGAFGVISYVFYSNIGWTDELGFLPLLVPGMFGSIGTVFFLRMYFDGIPNALVEAARLDGASFFQIYFKIMVPLAKPAFIAQFIFGFVGGYNSYLGPKLYLQNQPKFVTLQLYLSDIQALFPGAGRQNIYCAAAVLGMLPLIIIYCFLQKYFIEGIVAGSVKE